MTIEETPELIRTRALALAEYLLAIRGLAERPARTVAADAIWQHDLPVHADCVVGPGHGDDAFLSVGRPTPPAPPEAPDALKPFLVSAPGESPLLVAPQLVDEDGATDEVRFAFAAWRDGPWEQWRHRAEPAEATRNLHDRLYDLRYRIDSETAKVELVWGHVVVDAGTDGRRVRYPLLVTPVAIEYEADLTRVRVVAEGTPRLQVDALLGWDSHRIADLQELAGADNQVDLDVWDADERHDFAVRAMRRLGLDPVIRAQDAPAPSGAHVHDTGVLFVRPRQRMTRRFLEQLRERLAGSAGSEAVGALAGILAHEPSRLQMPADDANVWSPIGERLLMPIPTNEAQESIARRLAAHRNVAVQGPPGTGKTHTIRNLICHLVAHGKRVLVLAQKEDPLRVLRDGLPEEIQPLCLAILGRSADQLAQLQLAARELSDHAATLDPHTESDWAARVLGEIEQAEARIAETYAQLRDVAEREAAVYSHAGSQMTASQVGEWLRVNADDALIPDDVVPGTAMPLEPAEFTALIALARSSLAIDRDAALRPLPPDGSLPAAELLAAHELTLRDAQKVVEALRDQGMSVDGVRALGEPRVDELARTLRVAADQIARRHGTWTERLGRLVVEPTWQAVWSDHVSACGRLHADLAARTALLAGHHVAVPEAQERAPRRFLEQLTQIRARYDAGRSVSRLTHGDLARLMAACQVDGEPLRTRSDVDLVIAYIQRIQLRQQLSNRWAEWATRVGAPAPSSEAVAEPELWAGALLTEATDALDWDRQRWPQLRAELIGAWPDTPRIADAAQLGEIANALQACANVFLADELAAERDAISASLALLCDDSNASPVAAEAYAAWLDRDAQAWDACRAEIGRLWALRPDAQHFAELHARLADAAPRWAALVDEGRNLPTDSDAAVRAWHWREAQTWFDDVIGEVDTVELGREIERSRARIRGLTRDLVATRAWLEMAGTLDDRKKAALADWTAALRKIGKGTGKNASHWQTVAQQAMAEAVTAVPVWIMSVDRALEQFRGGEPLFDVVIVDEASQADIFALPTLTLAHRSVVVGDDQQIGPQLVGVPVDRVKALIDTHLADVPSSSHFDTDSSLYDHAVRRSPERILLTEHFRSVPSIIGFASQTYYDGKIQPLRADTPIGLGEPVAAVFVPDGVRTILPDYGEVNVPEALALVERAARIVGDPAYRDKTIGVVSLLSGSGQAAFIQHKLREAIGPEELERRSLRVGDAYTFQGDERDIVLMSMVVSGRDTSFGAFTKRDYHRRINVAATRARDQIWLFHSAGIGDFAADDARALLLAHAMGNAATAATRGPRVECEDDFQHAVLQMLQDRGLKPEVQFRLGRYRIDFLLTAPDGRRLAIECDSDRFQGADKWAGEQRRQATLERVGNASFLRVRSAVFHRAPEVALAPVWDRVAELGITSS